MAWSLVTLTQAVMLQLEQAYLQVSRLDFLMVLGESQVRIFILY